MKKPGAACACVSEIWTLKSGFPSTHRFPTILLNLPFAGALASNSLKPKETKPVFRGKTFANLRFVRFGSDRCAFGVHCQRMAPASSARNNASVLCDSGLGAAAGSSVPAIASINVLPLSSQQWAEAASFLHSIDISAESPSLGADGSVAALTVSATR